MESEQRLAKKLLQIKAVKLQPQTPFTWASGWKSPIYCDNRISLSHPSVRDYIKSELSAIVFEEFPEAEVIAGVATAGIPHGALVADLLKMPFIYVRSKAKEHGRQNQIEGELKDGQKVLVIEDLISTGKSSMEAIHALRDAGAQIEGLCSIFTYGFEKAKTLFEKESITVRSLSNYEALLTSALEQKLIEANEMEVLQTWRENPAEWNA